MICANEITNARQPTADADAGPGAAVAAGPAGTPADEALLDALARRLFAAYQDHLRRDGEAVPYARFEDQPPTLRRSCLEQARGFWDKAALLGCAVVAADALPKGAMRVEALSEADVEALARVEHDRWVAERRADGWTLGPAKDVARKVSPHLVPYDALSEQAKDYDREPVRALPSQLAAVGLALVR